MKKDLVNQIMNIRSNWTLQDFAEAYQDEWDTLPTNLEECQEKMESYIFHTYDTSYIQELIENEK